jgi:hypothetical protein
MRLLWAEAIDDMRTAIVIDTQYGSLIGGVAFMAEFQMDFGYDRMRFSIHGAPFNEFVADARMKLDFVWEWYRVVDSADGFRRSREWEKRLEAPLKQIEDKTGRRP